MPIYRPAKHTILNEQNVIALILFLDERDSANARELVQVSGNYVKIKFLAEKLKELELLDIKIVEKPRTVFTYSLTSKGKKLAEKLHEAIEITGE
jgi:DNA-binding HxlR family transcriptional regulator